MDMNVTVAQPKELLNGYMLEYYNEVLCNRSVPAIEDGLKPVQRKMLYAFNEKGYYSNKPFPKSAISVASVLYYSPHGDASAYDAAVNMSSYNNNAKLLDFEGGAKNIYGCNASAPRYTHLRLSKFSEDVLLDKVEERFNSVDYVPNFDQSKTEPRVLPSKMPVFLLNGILGLGTGFNSNILPHSIELVCDKTIQLIKNPDISIDEFIKDFLPEFPTGGLVCNKAEVIRSYKTPATIENKTSGKVVIRAKYTYDKKENSVKIYEIPYNTTTDDIIEGIKESIPKTDKEMKDQSKNLVEIRNIKNRCSKGIIDIRIYLKANVDVDAFMIKMFSNKATCLQKTYPIINILTLDGKLKIYNNVKEMINDWITFRVSTIKRIHNQMIKNYNYELHIKKGILKVCEKPENVDLFLKIVRNPKYDDQQIFDKVMNTFELSTKQTDYLLDLKTRKLSTVSIKTLKEDIKNLTKLIADEIKFISDDKIILKEIIKELEEIKANDKKNKYGKKSIFHTEFSAEDVSKFTIADSVEDKDCIVILTKNNYLKRVELYDENGKSSIKVQGRYGTGLNLGKMKDGDIPIANMIVNNKDTIFIFTSNGYSYKYKAYELPKINSLKNLGSNISELVEGNKIVSMVSFKDSEIKKGDGFVFLTKYGKIKFVEISNFTENRFSKLKCVKFGMEPDTNDDELLHVIKVSKKDKEIFVTNKAGFVIKSDMENVPNLGRVTWGKNSFNNKSTKDRGREILNCQAINDKVKGFIFIYSNGLGKRCTVDEFSNTNIGTIGVLTGIKEGSQMVACIPYEDDEGVLNIISNKGMITIKVKTIKELKRQSQGLRLKKLEDDEYIIDAVLIKE